MKHNRLTLLQKLVLFLVISPVKTLTNVDTALKRSVVVPNDNEDGALQGIHAIDQHGVPQPLGKEFAAIHEGVCIEVPKAPVNIQIQAHDMISLGNRDQSVAIGDGKRDISLSEIEQMLQELKEDDMRLDIRSHGGYSTERGEYVISLADGKTTPISEVFAMINRACSEQKNLQLHLWGCHSGGAESSIDSLPENTWLITHSAKERTGDQAIQSLLIENINNNSYKNPIETFINNVITSPSYCAVTSKHYSYKAPLQGSNIATAEGVRAYLNNFLDDVEQSLDPEHGIHITMFRYQVEVMTDNDLNLYSLRALYEHISYDSSPEIIDEFFESGIRFPSTALYSDGTTLLNKASQHGNMALVQRILNLPKINIASEGISLNSALKNNHPGIAELLIKEGVDLNAKTKDGWMPLHLALNNNLPDIAKLLIEKEGVDLNAKTKDGLTPLHRALHDNLPDIAKLLIEKEGVDLNAKTKDGLTPLHRALHNNLPDIAKLLIEKEGVDLNTKAKDGWTPLHFALSNNHLDIAELLIKKGVDLNAVTKDGWTPLHLALNNNLPDIAKLLIEKEGVDLNAVTKDGWTPLHRALSNNRLDIAKLLIKQGVNLDIIDSNKKWTPLWIALQDGHIEMAKLLIESGADLDILWVDGKTPLDYAQGKEGYEGIVELIAKKQLEDLIKDYQGDISVIKLLLNTNKDIGLNVPSDNGMTALSRAAQGGHTEIVNLLLGSGKDIGLNVPSDNGMTALSWAIDRNYIDIVKLLLGLGKDIGVNVISDNGLSPLKIALLGGYTEIANLLLCRDDINVNEALFAAVHQSDIATITRFIEGNVKPKFIDQDNIHIIVKAVERGDPAIVELVLKQGIILDDSTNLNGKSIFEIAKGISDDKPDSLDAKNIVEQIKTHLIKTDLLEEAKTHTNNQCPNPSISSNMFLRSLGQNNTSKTTLKSVTLFQISYGVFN